MPIILATQEAEIRRIMIQSQPGQIVYKTLPQQKNITKMGWWNLKMQSLNSKPSTAKRKKKNAEVKILQLLEENIRERSHYIGLGNNFLDMTTKAKSTKARIDK
jgi:hypothetical protein